MTKASTGGEKDKAEGIVDAVLKELRCRKGLDHEFDAIESEYPDTYDELHAKLVKIVETRLP